MKKVIAIIQVRMESTRLPNKALMMLGNKPCLQHVIERTKRAKLVDEVIVVTTTTRKNTAIVNFCRDIKCLCIKYPSGIDQDILSTVLYVMELFPKKDIIAVEITGDCAMIDPTHIDFTVKLLKKNKYDYVSNINVRSWPDGFDVQAYTAEILKEVDYLVTNPKHRKHAGWNIFNQQTFLPDVKLKEWIAPDRYHYPEWGLTLDAKEDYELLNHIFCHFKNNEFTAEQVINYLKKNPELLEINKSVKRKTQGEG